MSFDPNRPLLESKSYSTEYAKLLLGFFRHLTAISAGSIALQVGFLEKLFPHPKWKALIVFSVVSFTASIIGSFISQIVVISQVAELPLTRTQGRRMRQMGRPGMVAAWLGFLLGVISVAVFAIRNLISI